MVVLAHLQGVAATFRYQVVRVGHCVGLSEIGGTRCSRLHRPIRLKPSRSHSAQCALWLRP